MNPTAMEPYGQALRDCFAGDTAAAVMVRRDDGYVDDLPLTIFFRRESDFSLIERTTIDRCRGYVLDIGAGAGCHSLALQDRGMRVQAIDICRDAVTVMRQRGVREVRQIDVFDLDAGGFDTLLLLMHGIGVVEDLAGLDRFLQHARHLITVDGRIVVDSLDVRYTDEPQHRAYQQAKQQAGFYRGEVRMQFEYRGAIGPFFGWLHIDPETLGNHAAAMGWHCEILHREADGDYLAQLTLTDSIARAIEG